MAKEKIRIQMIETVRPDFFPGMQVDLTTIAKIGQQYEATSNMHGAICVICENGETIGVKPGEFTFVEAPEWVLKIHNKTKEEKPRQNIICAGQDGICLFCSIGDELEDEENCKFDNQRTEDGCPGFECVEQCRNCPENCEFYADNPSKAKANAQIQ